jgi:DNA polymerase I-like protein with 3'-5' exonuclease and polymerase domains
VQSFASDLTLLAMVTACAKLREMEILNTHAWLLGFIHDALLFEVDDAYVDTVKAVMHESLVNPPLYKFGISLPVPLDCELTADRTWE